MTFALPLFSLLFAFVSHHICLVLAAAPPHYSILSISLNSLDLAGVRLLSPCDSRILPNSCRCRWYLCRWRNRAQVGVRRGPWSLRCFVSWWSVVEPSWDDRGSSIWGCLLFYFGSVVGPWLYSGWCMFNLLFVWSGDYKPTLYPFLIQYMGLCKDYPSCEKTTMRLCL